MNRLKEIRNKLELTQIEMASLLGVSRRTYQTYEENGPINQTYNELLSKLDDIGLLDSNNVVLSLTTIKKKVVKILNECGFISTAYLFGSYARGEATKDSDVDIFVILKEVKGFEFFALATDLKEALGKDVDLVTFNQIKNNELLLKNVLTDGIKIYG